MEENQIGRRKFIKLTVATAAAAGLSHFRFLNAGVRRAYADQDIDCLPPDPDICEPHAMNPDSCKPQNGDEDICMSGFHDEDYCSTSASPPEPDVCDPPATPEADYQCRAPGADQCIPGVDPDLCEAAPGDEDVCIPGADPDYGCGVVSADFCEPATGDPDLCDPLHGERDECDPPDPDPADDPTAIDLASFDARADDKGGFTLSVLGGLVAVLGAATLWYRNRVQRTQPDTE